MTQSLSRCCTDSSLLSFTYGNIDKKHYDLSNLDLTDNTNKKFPDKVKNQIVSVTTAESTRIMSTLYNSIT